MNVVAAVVEDLVSFSGLSKMTELLSPELLSPGSNLMTSQCEVG